MVQLKVKRMGYSLVLTMEKCSAQWKNQGRQGHRCPSKLLVETNEDLLRWPLRAWQTPQAELDFETVMQMGYHLD